MHIDIRFHEIRELIDDKNGVIKYCPTEEQITYIFTKPLTIELFYKLKKMLGMTNLEAWFKGGNVKQLSQTKKKIHVIP